MAEHESRLLPNCLDRVGLPPLQTDPQLTFAFQAMGTRPPRYGSDCSCRTQRVAHPGRNLHAPRTERPLEEIELEHGLSGYMPPGKTLGLCLTENRNTIISVRRGRDSYRVRVHRMFAGAGQRMVHALARYVVHNDARASKLLTEFIESNKHLIQTKPLRARRLVLRTHGRVHDLEAVFERLNSRYFEGKHNARITWGPLRRYAQQQSIKVGSYSPEDHLIRVHPALDHEMVPVYFLEWIVFHEMLHGKHVIRELGGRRCFHPPEFSHEERQFPDYGRARLWEKVNLDRLLGS